MADAVNRRELLTLAAGGAAVAVLGPGALADAAASPLLPSSPGGIPSGGAQRFHSRPDLLAPVVVIDRHAPKRLGGLIVTETHLGAPQCGPLLLDQRGRIIWFDPVAADPTSPQRAFNVSVQRYRGQDVLCWFEGVVAGGHGVGYGQGHYEIVDASYNRVARVLAQGPYQGDLHEFFLTPDGTAIFSCYGTARTNVRVGGRTQPITYLFGVVQEVDVASGRLVWQWRSDRHIALSESYATPVPKSGWLWDYLHLNSIAIDPSDQNLVISGRNTSACYKINRRNGRIMWRMGGKHSDFHLGPGTRFHYQHHVNLHPDGVVTVFDNEGGPPRYAAQSRALVLSVDQRRRRVRLLQDFRHDPPVYSDALGSVQPLGGGEWFVGWGRSTNFTVYRDGGAAIFDGHLSPGSSSYRAFLQPWTGRPTSPPALAVTRSGGSAVLYASWNGSTELARWLVLGGTSPSALTSLGYAGVAGFETAIQLGTAPQYLAVAACDASGRVLARSAVSTGS